MDVDVTGASADIMNDTTGDRTRGADDTTLIEEQKRMDDTMIS